jgi:hypothetical protein
VGSGKREKGRMNEEEGGKGRRRQLPSDEKARESNSSLSDRESQLWRTEQWQSHLNCKFLGAESKLIFAGGWKLREETAGNDTVDSGWHIPQNAPCRWYRAL